MNVKMKVNVEVKAKVEVKIVLVVTKLGSFTDVFLCAS